MNTHQRNLEKQYKITVYAALIVTALILGWFIGGVAIGATINVQPTDSLQAKVDLASPGDTLVIFGNVATPVTASGVTINKSLHFTGAPGNYLKSPPNLYAFKPKAHNVTFDGITFDGNFFCNLDPFRPDGWSITNCKIIPRNGAGKPASWPQVPNWCFAGWTHQGAPTKFKFLNNDVGPVEAWCVLFMFGGKDIEIANNVFHDRQTPGAPQVQGRFIKAFGDGANQDATFPEGGDNRAKLTCGNLWVHHNLFQRWRGMCIENQDGWNGNVYEDNYYELPIAFGTKREDNLDQWINSIVETRSYGMKSRRNYYDARMPAGTPLVCFRVVEELEGCAFESTDNLIILNGTSVGPDNSSNVSFAVNGTNSSGKIIGNKLVNAPGPVGSNLNPAKVQLSNNSATTVLTWDTNRPRPGTSTPATQPSFVASLSATGDTTGDLIWNPQVGVTSYQIETKTSQGVDHWKPLGNVANAPAHIKGFHAGWEYSARVIAGSNTSQEARTRIGDISLSTGNYPDNPALETGGPTTEPTPPQYVDDPITKVTTIIEQKSGKQTKTTANVP